jgi:hypothetical protein
VADNGQVAQTPCSGNNLIISSVFPTSVDVGGGKNNPGGQSISIPANVSYVAPANAILQNELVSFTGSLDNSGNCVATSMTIASGLALTPISFTTGSVGSAYPVVNVTPLYGVQPYTISVSGLPNGLSYDPVAGTIGGVPAAGSNGSYTVVISVNDSAAETLNTNYTLTITPPPAIVLGKSSLPTTAHTGYAYVGSVSAKGGAGSLSWSATGLPGGVSIDPVTGKISGKPLAAGIYNAVLTVTDSAGQTKTVSVTITVKSTLVIAGSYPKGTLGVAYTATPTVSGTYGTLNWTASGLGNGLSIDAGSGVISGVPTAVGTQHVTLTVTDALLQIQHKVVNLVIGDAPIIITSSLPATGKVGVDYSATETASGGSGALTWTAVGLPAGVTISSTGQVSGTPSKAGTYHVSLTVKDGFNTKATHAFTVVISK